jgi:hypothetical protein
VPQKNRLLTSGGDGRVIAVLVAIRAGKNDDAEFHYFIILATPHSA